MSGNKKNDRFKKITAARSAKINDMLRLIGNCSNKNNYSYSKQEVEELFEEIEKNLSDAKKRYGFFDEKASIDCFRNEFEKGYTWIAGFLRNVIRFPDKKAIVCPYSGKSWSYIELNEEINRLANTMLLYGVKKGDKILYQMDNCAEFVFIYVACQKIGAVGCPIYKSLAPAKTASVIDFIRPEIMIYEYSGDTELALTMVSDKPKLLIITSFPKDKRAMERHISYEDFVAGAESSEPEPECKIGAYDETMGFYTSGTMGKQKYVPVTSINEILSAHDMIMQLGIKYSDVLFNFTSWPHRGSLHCLGPSTSLYAGTTLVMMKRFDPQACLKIMERYKVTFASGTPVELNAVSDVQEKEDYNLGTLRGIVSTGSKIGSENYKRYKRLLCENLFNGYGTTETFWNTVLRPEESYFSPEASGMPCVDDDVRIVKLYSDRRAKPDELVVRDGKTEGEIIIQSMAKSSCFCCSEDEEASCYKNGYFYTNDIGTWNEDGLITVIGRNDDMIIFGGEKIYMTEIEEFLKLHPGIQDCLVTFVDLESGERLIAAYIIKARGELSLDEVYKFCVGNDDIANSKIPQLYRFKKVLPKTPNGKKQRKKAYKMAANDFKNGMFYRADSIYE